MVRDGRISQNIADQSQGAAADRDQAPEAERLHRRRQLDHPRLLLPVRAGLPAEPEPPIRSPRTICSTGGYTIQTTMDKTAMDAGSRRSPPTPTRRRRTHQKIADVMAVVEPSTQPERVGPTGPGAGGQPPVRPGRRQGTDGEPADHDVRAAGRRVDVQGLHRRGGAGKTDGHRLRSSTRPRQYVSPITPNKEFTNFSDTYPATMPLAAGTGDVAEHRVRGAGGPGRAGRGGPDVASGSG